MDRTIRRPLSCTISGQVAGGKGDAWTLIPLCVFHHRGNLGVHGLGTKGFAKHHGFDQQDLLNDALGLLEGETA